MEGLIVYKNNSAQANEILERMVQDYQQMGIKCICHHRQKIGYSWAKFDNGDYWKVIRASDNARGHKCNIIYVERSIDWDVYQTIVMPMAINHPYCGIHLWGEGNLHITDIQPLPF